MSKSHRTKLKLTVLFFLIFSANFAFAQKKVKLTNIETGEEIILNDGMRVACIPKKRSIITGILKVYSDSSIQIGNTVIQIKNIKAINARKAGTTTISIMSILLCSFSMGLFVLPDHNPEIIRAPIGIALLSLLGYSFYHDQKNAVVNVTREWKLQVIE